MGVVLDNGVLEAEVKMPEEAAGSRFDRTGWIACVRLKGRRRHEFGVPESFAPGRGTGGSGLCAEFGISGPNGYDDAGVGEGFPKIGVGLLTRQGVRDYSFFEDYPVVPYQVVTETGIDRIKFTVLPADCRGYAFRLTKSITLRDARIHIEYMLENTGSRTLESDEYVHNFLAVNRQPAGPGYVLRFPVPVVFSEVESDYTTELLSAAGNEVLWNAVPEREFYARLPGWPASMPWNWELIHLPSGAGVRESGDFAVAACALWGKRHVISPEIFISLHIPPGQTGRWSRTYEFFEI
ncbi:hypothetical protein D3C75_176910 [compost metagenome]